MRTMHGAAVIALVSSLLFCAVPSKQTPPPASPAMATATADAGPPPPPFVPPTTRLVVPWTDEITTSVDDGPQWKTIDATVQAAIDEGKMPGCVVVVGRHDSVLFERAYGSRALLPDRVPMTTDTLFDLASLTKPVSTATSLMVLVERGRVDLDARAATYVPELTRLPPFTLRHLLTHTSGLPAGTPMSQWSTNRAEVIRNISFLSLKSAPGAQFNYSDVGFVVLQEVIQRVTGKPLQTFAAEEVFGPLGMKDTGYLPQADLRGRAAATEWRDGGYMQGEVHDPRAWALGGVGGHAGVFSTARDLSRYARAMLEKGTIDGKRVFSDATFAKFTTRHETSKGGRGLGWDIDSSFATHRSALLSKQAFGHGGYTGTAMWIDPEKDLFLVFLSNRVHPDGKGVVNPTILEIASNAIAASETQTGIDVLRAESFERLRGAKIGLVTNASAKAKDGTSTVDVLRAASANGSSATSNAGFGVRAIFTPEHGLNGDREGNIGDSTYNGIPVHSLYGDRFTPSSSSLADVDTIVFDLQDVGMRFYTYASTMKRAMKIANEKRLRFVVLDRPNPINGVDVQGPVLAESDVKGFVNHHPLPLRHGMTMGELAQLFAAEEKLEGLKLDVVKLVGWRRRDPYERTGLTWAAPSPNLKSTKSVALYPAIGLLESTNVSVGRGTDLPFEIVAAPWMDSEQVAKKLAADPSVMGVTFEPIEITPTSSVHANKRCRGLRIRILDRTRFEPIRMGIAIAQALRETHPSDWNFEAFDRMLRYPPAMAAMKSGKSMAEIEATWASDLATFKEKRERFLLYK